MIWETLTAARDLGRLHDIASILIRFGFGDMVRLLGMGQALERFGKVLHWKKVEELALLEPPERIRRALEELGPTFVKLGQVLATRVDLFSPEYIAEFEKLQDAVPAIPFDQLRVQLEEDLGGLAEACFASVDVTPLAAASIAQVHRATLKDGSEVVLKIRRPGIRKKIEADLRLMARLADVIELEMPEFRQFKPSETVRQFSRSLQRELDLAAECRNAERMASCFAEDPNIIIPKVYWEWTSERLNVQEYIQGIPGRQLEAVDAAGLDRKVLARRGANAVLKMIIKEGFFHADPHPGNLFYLPGEKIAFIDFGMVGFLSERRRHQLVELLNGVVNQKADRVAEVMLDWSNSSGANNESLVLDMDIFIDQHHSLALSELNAAELLTELIGLMREHKLALPPDLALLTKALFTLEGLGRQLDPEFDISTEVKPFLNEALLARYTPDALAKRGWQGMSELVELVIGLPTDLRGLVRVLRKNAFRVNVDISHLEQFINRIDRSVSRLTMGMVTSALIIGSSIVMTVEGGPTLFGLPFFGLLGFLGAIAGGIWLLISIWLSGKSNGL